MVHAAHVPRPADGLAVPRAGFVVSKAVGNSVVRSRTTRVLRHIVAAELSSIPNDVDIVVRAQPAVAGVASQRVARDLHRELQHALARVRRPQ